MKTKPVDTTHVFILGVTQRQFLNIYRSEKSFLPTLWSKLEAKLHIQYKFSIFIVCCFCSQPKENESFRNIALCL
jgi:hypothetical protein